MLEQKGRAFQWQGAESDQAGIAKRKCRVLSEPGGNPSV